MKSNIDIDSNLNTTQMVEVAAKTWAACKLTEKFLGEMRPPIRSCFELQDSSAEHKPVVSVNGSDVDLSCSCGLKEHVGKLGEAVVTLPN
jgi:hypothetical protein